LSTPSGTFEKPYFSLYTTIKVIVGRLSQNLPAYFAHPLLFLLLSIHNKEVHNVESLSSCLGIYCAPSRQGEGGFEQRISRFINLGVIILVAFVREVKLFAAADLTRLKMRSNLSRLRK
jgi:hypothetical protein